MPNPAALGPDRRLRRAQRRRSHQSEHAADRRLAVPHRRAHRHRHHRSRARRTGPIRGRRGSAGVRGRAVGVGTYAGQVVMQGFIRTSIPLFLRRGLTMLPALTVLALGLPTTASLVISQVVLSFGIPFALIPLLLITRRRDIMGSFVNQRITTATAGLIVGTIIALNTYLLHITFAG